MPETRDHSSSPASDAINRRKRGHVEACLDDGVDLGRDSFSNIKLAYRALPELSLADVSTGSEFAGRPIAAPIVISSMTGGSGAEFVRLNANLARGAERLGLPLGLGSMKVMLRDESAVASFQVRDLAPSVPLIANLGLVSFNYGLGWDDVLRIVDRIRPDVFAVHLNALQEAIQEGGDTDFRGLEQRLRELAARCPVPVYVKECGGGIAPELVEKIAGMGVAYIDVSGSDGTSWAAVEARLSRDPSLGEMFADFGLPTRWILERLEGRSLGSARIVASGGIRDGIQMVKALALGADYVGVARPFLLAAQDSADAVVEVGSRLIREMRTALFLIGARLVADVSRTHLIEPGD